MVGGVGYFAATIGREDGRPDAAKFMFDVMNSIIDNIHAGNWTTRQ